MFPSFLSINVLLEEFLVPARVRVKTYTLVVFVVRFQLINVVQGLMREGHMSCNVLGIGREKCAGSKGCKSTHSSRTDFQLKCEASYR